jgi:hypothetical protein
MAIYKTQQIFVAVQILENEGAGRAALMCYLGELSVIAGIEGSRDTKIV